MIGYGCGVSQYPEFYVIYLNMYQVLPCQYLLSFDDGHGDMLIKRMDVRLGKSSRNIVWECIESRITSDNIENEKRSQYWTNLKKT